MAATVAAPSTDLSAGPPAGTPCPNCGSTMVAQYCARCGEQQPAHRDLSIRAVAYDAAQEFVGVDGKIPRTLWALISKPGLLTREFIDGRRGRYSKPLSLFLVLNVLFFFIQPHTGLLKYSLSDYIDGDGDGQKHRAALVAAKVAKAHQSDSTYAIRFDATLADQKKSMLLFAVPVFAVAIAALFAGSRHYFVEHVVFAVHAYAFMLVMLAVGTVAILLALAGWIEMFGLIGVSSRALNHFLFNEPGLVTIISLSLFIYLAVAIRRAYGGPLWAVAARAATLVAVQMCLIPLYRSILFYTALYST